jgi:hypothetical protein
VEIKQDISVGFEVLTVVVMKIELFMTFQVYCIALNIERPPVSPVLLLEPND